MEKHYGFRVAPVFDTMLAARRSKESKYSLKAQSEIHLNLRLDKAAQRSDWSRRPLDVRQLHYAALDPYATLLLYESQTERNLTGVYRLRPMVESAQTSLPLNESPPSPVESPAVQVSSVVEETSTPPALAEAAVALPGVITELPTRYSPGALAASVGVGRVGLAGWIIDRRLGADSEPDEETVKLAIADLCENKLVGITDTRRLEATETGARLWEIIR